MKMKKYSKGLVVGMAFTAGLSVGPAGAMSVGDAVLNATLGNGDVFSTVLSALVDVATGGRGANADASAEGGTAQSLASTTSFGGDTGLLIAVSDGSDSNFADAFARNVLRGKVAEAGVTGVGQAMAALSWNGAVKWSSAASGGTTTQALISEPPLAEDVVSATLTFTYQLEDNQVKAGANGSGSYDMEISWNGETTFNGGAGFDEATDDGAVSLTGDLSSLSGSFSNSDFLVESDDLDISQEVVLSLSASDILSFFGDGVATLAAASGEITTIFAGSMTATAAGTGSGGNGDDEEVPEPGTLLIFAAGLTGLGIVRRRRKSV